MIRGLIRSLRVFAIMFVLQIVLISCEEDSEIFDNVVQTDEENEKKQKPGA